MKVERVVLDTNVLISAALSAQGKPAVCYDWVIAHCTLISSLELISELETRLGRSKFAKYLSDVRRVEFVERLSAVAELVILTGAITACRDPDDDKVLETAVLGRADCILSGDRDLQVLNPFQGIPILSPAAFVLAAVNPADP